MSIALLSIALALPMLAQQAGQQQAGKQQAGQPQVGQQQPGQPQAGQQQGGARQDANLPKVNLDGQWTVVYAEMEGKREEPKGFTQVTIQGNTVTCRHEGKERSWKLEFGPHNLIRCTEQTQGTASATPAQAPAGGSYTHHGVYIAAQDYFCLSLNKGADMRHLTFTGTQQGTAQPGQAGATPPTTGNQQQGAQQQRTSQPGQPGAGIRFGEHGAQGAEFVIILHRGSGTGQSR